MTAQLRRLRHDIQGHEIVPASDPSAFVEIPWNSWTYEVTNTSATASQGYYVTVQDVLTQIKDRIGLSGTAVIRLKVQSARVWLTSAGGDFPHPELRSSFYEINGQSGSATARSIQRDLGTLNTPAKAGYSYPIDDRKEVLTSANNAISLCSAIATETGSRTTMRLQVLWQSTGP
jgi:hypothetical protein